MMVVPDAFIEHAAYSVKDVDWHIRFFEDVFSMGIRKINGPAEAPERIWLYGGLQLDPRRADDDSYPRANRLTHICLMVEDYQKTLEKANAWNVVTDWDERRAWMELPEGIMLEVKEAPPGIVADYFKLPIRP